MDIHVRCPRCGHVNRHCEGLIEDGMAWEATLSEGSNSIAQSDTSFGCEKCGAEIEIEYKTAADVTVWPNNLED